MRTRSLVIVVLGLAMVVSAQEQQKPAEQPKQEAGAAGQASAKQPAMSASARLASAKTIFVKKGRGSDIPYNVISEGLAGWGKYMMVSDPEKADLVIDITAPAEGGGVSISSSTGQDSYGKPESSTKTTRDLSSSAMITMTVYDARNKVPLWRASEQAKSAMKQKARQDNLVDASQKILAKFRDRVEPIK